jgi:L-alanine-DL-glutamate epimerase-like enolase superfamily enzyme
MNLHDICIENVLISFHPYDNRVPLKFGHEVSTGGETVMVRVRVAGRDGRHAEGIGETPLGAAWIWPHETLSKSARVDRMRGFCGILRDAWAAEETEGHPMEIGHHFLETRLQECLDRENAGRPEGEQMPYLAALVCCSAFDLAVYDAYGMLHSVPVFDCLNAEYMNRDLSGYYTESYRALFKGRYPEHYLLPRGSVPDLLPACHLVGGKDLLEPEELTGSEPDDGYPVLLRDWIDRDGLFNLKIKLTGNDAAWDYARIVHVGKIAIEKKVRNLTADFNCTVTDPEYVNAILDRLKQEEPEIYAMILYVEQPFPYDLEKYRIDVHSCSSRVLLLMDESAHDWRLVELGYELGWTGVALKTCKTLTGALLSLCWAREHGMAIMVQDLTNPRLAIIPHALLAANAGTIMGVEVNSMQFCPDASADAARIHPGIYRRRGGCIDLSTLGKAGFGYRYDEIEEAERKAGNRA